MSFNCFFTLNSTRNALSIILHAFNIGSAVLMITPAFLILYLICHLPLCYLPSTLKRAKNKSMLSFLKPAVFDLSFFHNQKNRIALKSKIKSEIESSGSYFLLLIGSTIITTLGLLINNSAVVIGAMIMAPLYWPMLGVALGIAAGDRQTFGKAFRLLFYSIILVLFIGLLTTSLVPLSATTQEINLRISPTLLDLLVALSSSLIGMLAVYDPRIPFSVAGVALSLSLLPPLAVAGVGLSFKNQKIFLGSSQLFLVNTIAVITVGVIALYLLNIRPRKKKQVQYFILSLMGLLSMLVLLSFILVVHLRQAVRVDRFKQNLEQKLILQLKQIDGDIRIKDTSIDFFSLNNLASIETFVYLPEGVYLTQSQKSEMVAELDKIVSYDVDLKLNLISTLLLRQEEKVQSEISPRISNMLNMVMDRIAQNHPDSDVFINQDISWIKSGSDISPGYSLHTYTNGDWTVVVGHGNGSDDSASEQVYDIKAEYDGKIMWTGTITDGVVSEESYRQRSN